MDILIDGDISLDNCGFPKEIYGIDEACQRVRLTLSTLRGNFIYNRNFGADLSRILSGEYTEDEAALLGEGLCREALISQKELSVSDVSFVRRQGKLFVRVKVQFLQNKKYTEVQIS